MNYQEIYDKLISLSKDQSTTPGERHAAKVKAVQIRKKHLDKPFRQPGSAANNQTFKDAKSPGSVDSQWHFRFHSWSHMNQFSTISGSSIFQENPALKEQLKRAIFGVIKEREELIKKGEL